MEDLWNVISDASLIPVIQDQTSLKRFYPQLDLSFNEQYRININFDPSLKVYYQIESKHVTDYCCTLVWKGYLACTQFELFKSISTLHYITPESTLFIIKYIFPVEYKHFIKEEAQRRLYYSSIDKFIASRDHLKIDNDVRVIKGDVNTAIQCLLNFMTCLDLVFDQSNGNQHNAKTGMIVNSNIKKPYMLNGQMNIIYKLIKVERRSNYIQIISYAYDKDEKLPHRHCQVEIFSNEEEEKERDNEMAYCHNSGANCNVNMNGGQGIQALRHKEKNFVLNFRHTFLAELNTKQLAYAKYYKNLFVTKFTKIVTAIDERRLLKNLA